MNIGLIAATLRLEANLLRRSPGELVDFAIAPLLALIFLAIFSNAGREDLVGYAIFAPVMMALWSRAVYSAGDIVATDRWLGVLEPMAASPVGVPLVVLGRVGAISLLGLISVVETLVVALVLFRADLVIAHPAVLLLTLLATATASTGTGILAAAIVARFREPTTFQNSITYPFYVLSGVLVPVSLLPDWIEPLSRVVFLSWASDLLRDSLGGPAVEALPQRLGVILLLGAAGGLLGLRVMRVQLDSLRREGRLSKA